jgi:hypothetical protein
LAVELFPKSRNSRCPYSVKTFVSTVCVTFSSGCFSTILLARFDINIRFIRTARWNALQKTAVEV